MKNSILLLLMVVWAAQTEAAKIKGKVTDEKGEALPFASIYIKGTTKGTTSNLEGHYSYDLPMGTYTFICQYVGFQKQEVDIKIDAESISKNFVLVTRGNQLKQVVIKNGEDPALRMIRKTIKKRSDYNKEIDAYKANAYIKGSFKLNDINTSKNMMVLMRMSGSDSASKSERDELESSKGILLLTESYTEIAYKQPDKLKVVVKGSRVSGDKGAYGFSEPLFVNLYDNIVSISDELNPRGFISPIAETAMLNYRYELLETYQEDGKTISVIKVIPRRKFEPLFAGTINIIENEWRLHSVNLIVDQEHQMAVFDTLQIKQIFVPVHNTMMVKDQSFKMKFKIMGFGFSGNFVNVFTDYIFDYDTQKTFDKFIQEYDKEALTHPKSYWDTMRPVPLETDEVIDYIKKDSIETAANAKKDTTNIKPQKNSLGSFVTKGYKHALKNKQYVSTSPIISVGSLLRQVNWNTAEGASYSYSVDYRKKINNDKAFIANLDMRYGFSNQQFNAKINTKYAVGKTNKSILRISGGRYVFQYNNYDPVNPLINSCYTLFYGSNYLKLYQAWFGTIRLTHTWINGFSLTGRLNYQDRIPLANSNLFSFRKNNVAFTENYPVEKLSAMEPRHQAIVASVQASYQPGRKYIKYPDRIVSTKSNYPTFYAEYVKGLAILNSDVDYDRWKLTMQDDMNLRIWGTFKYWASVGGFIQQKKTYLADYTHFNGNQIILASPYLNSFQLSSYYANSNTEHLFVTLHAEHHFYGLLTNKIPLFRNLTWYLVGSSNAYYVNKDNNYIEVSAGLENIGYKMLRMLRVDAVVGYSNLTNPIYGIRIGINESLLNIDLGGRQHDDY